MTPLERMELHKDEFTTKELEVYGIIRDNYNLISGSTATVFASNFGISQSVLSRFCKKLGYSGYGELRMAMYQVPRRTQMPDEPEANGYLERMASSISALAHNVTLSLEETELNRAVDRLISANRIYVLGQGMSMAPATAFTIQTLIRSLPAAYLNAGFEAESLHCMTDSDVAVIFSVRNPTFEIFLETARELPSRRVPHTILVTLSPNHPHAKLVDETFVLPRSIGGIDDVNLSSLYPMLFFGTYLLQAVDNARATAEETDGEQPKAPSDGDAQSAN